MVKVYSKIELSNEAKADIEWHYGKFLDHVYEYAETSEEFVVELDKLEFIILDEEEFDLKM